MNWYSKCPLIAFVFLLSLIIPFSSASENVSSVIHPSARALVEQQCFPTTIDQVGDVGYYTSLQLNANDNAVISYQEYSFNKKLKLASCDDAACKNPTITTIDQGGNVGYYTSLQLNADGNAVISYQEIDTNYEGKLKLASCDDAACKNPTITTIDQGGDVGYDTSLQLNADGNAVISYQEIDNNYHKHLKLASCDNAACKNPTVTTIDQGENVGYYSSLQLNADGNAVISYQEIDTNYHRNLKLASCDDAACKNPTITTIDQGGDVGYYTSLQLNADGNAVISYQEYDTNYEGKLKLASCDDAACKNPTITTIGQGGDVGYYTSLQLKTDGNAVISYQEIDTNYEGKLKLASCDNPACLNPDIKTIIQGGDVGYFTSLQLKKDGNAVISYRDGVPYSSIGKLMLYSCVNIPTTQPSEQPSQKPSNVPTKQPSEQPSQKPVKSKKKKKKVVKPSSTKDKKMKKARKFRKNNP